MFSFSPLAPFADLGTKVAEAAVVEYNFNSTDRAALLANSFNEGGGDQFQYAGTDGLNNSGAVDVDHKSNIWTAKAPLSPEEGSFRVSGYFYNADSGDGFGSLGFSHQDTNSVGEDKWGASGNGIGISFHGGGGRVWNDAGSVEDLNWQTGEDLENNAWYHMSFEITPTSGDNFDVTFKIHSADSNGTILCLVSEHDISGIENTLLAQNGDVFGYFGAYNARVSFVDNFKTGESLSGYEACAPGGNGGGEYAGGDGSEENPYIITTPEEFMAIADEDDNAEGIYYLLGNDITLPNNYEPFDFDGAFDGDGNIIKGLNAPLFNEIDGGEIVNLNIDGDIEYEGDPSGLGLLASAAYDSNIENVSITGSITISGVSESCSEIGGAVGYLNDANINRVAAKVNINAPDCLAVGGLAGWSMDSSIFESFAVGDVSGATYVGGLVGYYGSAVIANSYARGKVTGSDRVGGLVGYYAEASSYKNYSTGAVIGSDHFGGLVGEAVFDGYFFDSFWDKQTSGQINSDQGTGLTTTEMKTESTYTSIPDAGMWDFDDIWAINSGDNDGYPCLQWYCGNNKDTSKKPTSRIIGRVSTGGNNGGTIAQLQAQLNTLLQQLAQLQGSSLPLNTGMCSADLIITQNMKQGNKDGIGGITEVKILQSHINRILASQYNQAAGPIDGIFGILTKQGVERLQSALNSSQNAHLIIDGIVGPFTRAAINNSCGE